MMGEAGSLLGDDARRRTVEKRNDSKITYRRGRGEFIGNLSDAGSDREQRERDAARKVYDANLRRSTVSRDQEIRQGSRDHWAEAKTTFTSWRVANHRRYPR